ncbi:DUF4270 domain-containing protein [Aequorivita echinoideorum]|uniref:DUF4270 family protein n=1 Tax=Aequorivita echinoideorum TaxID=1549647 RepID=A0ABS5S168_9FLAO|nr:DUF4270 domain-containing protein [Aequorivita echinoideorum]MBT0606924.1 DUF4270 family protein [Aequorivita echinoideorum]
MKIKNLLPKLGAILFIIIAMASCQEDISTIGSEILGEETPNGILFDQSTVIAYSKKLNSVQTNRLPAYQLGVYNDAVFGKTTANLLSQLTLSQNAPTFGENASLDSVYIYIPYFSTGTTVDSETTYVNDSIFGNSEINIRVSRSNYFLRDLDPNSNFEQAQKYYSDDASLFEANLGEELAYIEDFKPNSNGYIFNEGTDDEVILGPGLRIKLDSTFFAENILAKEGMPELSNNNNFINFLRGIYVETSSPTDDGSLFLFNPANANITLYYSSDGDDGERESDTFVLNLGGINVNTFEREIPAELNSTLENQDVINGEENIYLRGGDVLGIVELFGEDLDGNGVPEELEMLREKQWLINEANLIFYVNQDVVAGGSTEPERIVIYDINNSNVLADYTLDYTNGLAPVNALNIHLGRLDRGNDENGDFYKIRITNHISNLINRDSTNVKLGVMVSQNVLAQTTQGVRIPTSPGVKDVPTSAVISPEGTVLYGNASANLEKRLKLQIYYTEPN